MKVAKKIISIVVIAVISLMCLIPLAKVYAAEATTPLVLGVMELRTGKSDPELGYAIGNPDSNGSTEADRNAFKLWNIVKYESMQSDTYEEADIYCVKEGVGFSDARKKAEYDIFYDMKKEKDTILNHSYEALRTMGDGTIDIGNGKTIERYNAILALFDMMYLSGISTDEEMTQLLEDAGISNSQLTIDEVEAVQQAALWYFTNYGDAKYDKTEKNDWLWYTEDGNEYENLSDYNPTSVEPNASVGAARQKQASQLYNYLVDKAKLNAVDYSIDTNTEAPAKLETTTLQYREQGENYVFGPIKFTETAGNTTPYTLDFVVKDNGQEVQNYTLLNSSMQEVQEGTTVKDLVGQDFYISLPKDGDTTITIETNIKYSQTKLTLWTSSTNAKEQPVVIPERTEVEVPGKLEAQVVAPQSFDLKLIKRIVAVNGQNVPERIENVDVSKLNTIGEDGRLITTGEYTLSKEPVTVQKGDIVTYTFRIYNEGTIDGYAQEITEDIPEGLEFIWSEKTGQELEEDETLTEAEKEAIKFNQDYLWGNFVYDENNEKIIQISTDYLSKENETTVGGNLIPAFGENDGTKTEEDIHYKEVSVMLKVVSDNTSGTVIRNEAAITEDCDENGDPVDDRDSETEEWVKYEDDEDYDNIKLQAFDLALRKFIVAVSDDTTIDEEEYLRNEDGSYKREPIVDTSNLNKQDENGNIITTAIYNHTKEPVLVQPNNIVVYMLRVYNEGELDGYASEIKDHLPPYLEFVEGEFNEQYGWEISEDGRTVTSRYLEDELIEKAQTDENGNITLSYVEVPIMCKVVENPPTSENITNIADITEYLDENKEPVTDRDSQEDNVELPSDEDLPGYKDDETGTYVPGQQDDDDFEKVIVKTFDLALRKWVTQAIVIENGKQTITETGHQPYDDPEQVVKVELHRKKINEVTVKFRYSIRVINEGEIEGYAKEITDYIPEGLKFVAEDNPGWTDEGNNVVSTRLLENTLLQPGEYADVEIVLTWINNSENMGLKVNTAEISEDYNDYDIPDKDSTPDNKQPGEDDIDDAPVMLSIETGSAKIYISLGLIILITIAGGTFLIKKYVI